MLMLNSVDYDGGVFFFLWLRWLCAGWCLVSYKKIYHKEVKKSRRNSGLVPLMLLPLLLFSCKKKDQEPLF